MIWFDMANYKRIFLDGYRYYITIVTYERNPILLANIALLRESFRYAKSLFEFDINEIVIMPDHLHMIIDVKIAREYPKIISIFKRYFSKHCDPKYYQHVKQSKSREVAGYKPLWQKRFYEHTIRDEKDYLEKVEYIRSNPVKHGYVENIHDWKFGSLYYHQKS
jgi:putative transposase